MVKEGDPIVVWADSGTKDAGIGIVTVQYIETGD